MQNFEFNSPVCVKPSHRTMFRKLRSKGGKDVAKDRDRKGNFCG